MTPSSPSLRETLSLHGLAAYADAFEREGVLHKDLPTISDADLSERLGVRALGDRENFRDMVRSLGSSPPADFGATRMGESSADPGATRMDAEQPDPGRTRSLAVGADPGATRMEPMPDAPDSGSTQAPSTFTRQAYTPPRVGAKLLDRYYLVKELGRGAMGVVFKAVDEVTKSDVAVKVLLPELALSTNAIEMLLKEASLAQQISHPNLLRINHVEGGEQPFIVMEYVDGDTLTTRWEEKRRQMDEVEVRRMLSQLLTGLAYLHAQNLVHRDVKPDNILVSRAGDIKLTDYGIASTLKEQIDGGVSAGTLLYMSPEQLRGQQCDARTDLYAVGIMTFQLLEGKFPFGIGALDEIRAWHLDDAHALPAFVTPTSPPLQAVIRKLVVGPIEGRYRSAEEARSALDQDGQPRSKIRQWALLAGKIAVGVLGIGGAVWAVQERGDALEEKIAQQQEQLALQQEQLAQQQYQLARQKDQSAIMTGTSGGGVDDAALAIAAAQGGDGKASLLLGLASHPNFGGPLGDRQRIYGLPRSLPGSLSFFRNGEKSSPLSQYYATFVDPNVQDYKAALATVAPSCISDFFLGNVLWREGDLKAAETAFLRSRTYLDRKDELAANILYLPDTREKSLNGDDGCAEDPKCATQYGLATDKWSEWELCRRFVFGSMVSQGAIRLTLGDESGFVKALEQVATNEDATIISDDSFSYVSVSRAPKFPNERGQPQVIKPDMPNGEDFVPLPGVSTYGTADQRSSAAFIAAGILNEYFRGKNRKVEDETKSKESVCVQEAGSSHCFFTVKRDVGSLQSAKVWIDRLLDLCSKNKNQGDCRDYDVESYRHSLEVIRLKVEDKTGDESI